jgi:hypothetical protein
MSSVADRAPAEAPPPERTPGRPSALVPALVVVLSILVVAVAVLVAKVVALQDDVAALRSQTSSATPDVQASPDELAVCRMLGALAATSHVSLESLFPDSTLSTCEAAATEAYHRAVTTS